MLNRKKNRTNNFHLTLYNTYAKKSLGKYQISRGISFAHLCGKSKRKIFLKYVLTYYIIRYIVSEETILYRI